MGLPGAAGSGNFRRFRGAQDSWGSRGSESAGLCPLLGQAHPKLVAPRGRGWGGGTFQGLQVTLALSHIRARRPGAHLEPEDTGPACGGHGRFGANAGQVHAAPTSGSTKCLTRSRAQKICGTQCPAKKPHLISRLPEETNSTANF